MPPPPTIERLLTARLRSAVDTMGAPEIHDLRVVAAADPRHADYQTNAAMLLAKAMRTSPTEIARRIVEALDVEDVSAPPQIAGAGFINFRVSRGFLEARLAEIAASNRLAVPQAEATRIVIDFSAPNVAKPMHVGHIRSTILGDCLARVARFLGHDVVTDNHIGDWGTQFGKVIYGWKHFLDEAALKASPVEELVRVYREANHLAETDSGVLDACRRELVLLQGGNPENLAIWRKTLDLSREAFDGVYKVLGVEFDEWLGESFYNDRLGPLVERLLADGIACHSEGAVCVFFEGDPDLAGKPCLIRKSDGGFLYATTDLATIEYRIQRWSPDAIWYVTGAPQRLHFQQVFEVARKMGARVDLRHVAFGSILGEDRKLMKTRSGGNVQLSELLVEAVDRARAMIEEKNPDLPADEKQSIAKTIGLGAVKYAELSQFRMSDYVFSWDKLLSLQGNTAPYLQNAHVRIRSIFRKAGKNVRVAAVPSLVEPAERELALQLVRYAEVVPQVLDDFRPNALAAYLYELADRLHGFYESCPVLQAEAAVGASRLALCDLTARTIQHGLDLLGIGVPERM